MSAAAPIYSFLMARFAAFYEEVAQIKRAAQNDDLVRFLQPDNPHGHIEPAVLAEMVANRLLVVLDLQQCELKASATQTEWHAYAQARYVMTALADEVFILNLVWPAAESWPEHLLEYSVQRTRIAGRQFFVLAQGLLDNRAPTLLDIDFAAVLLLALQLGFQGMHRGSDGQPILAEYRRKLYRLASTGQLDGQHEYSFPQAYDYTVVLDRDNSRLALGPWLRAVAYGVIGYLVVSSIVWMLIAQAPLREIGRELCPSETTSDVRASSNLPSHTGSVGQPAKLPACKL